MSQLAAGRRHKHILITDVTHNAHKFCFALLGNQLCAGYNVFHVLHELESHKNAVAHANNRLGAVSGEQ